MPAVPRTAALLVALAVGCLPADPPGFQRDAGVPKQPKRVKRGDTASHERSRARPKASAKPAARLLDAGSLINEPWGDDFNREELGPDWYATSDVWRIEDGRLCGRGAKNHPVWLQRRLPKNARIEFDATSNSPEGDIKAEAWGDGSSAATANSYEDATSYLFVFGGWRNRMHVLARLNEHGSNRLEVRLIPGSEDPRTQPVVEGRSYHIEIERDDGRTVHFSVDDTEIHAFEDSAPLAGPGHEHFAFNDWQVPVCFDDLLITPFED
jgi:hypothetical protein